MNWQVDIYKIGILPYQSNITERNVSLILRAYLQWVDQLQLTFVHWEIQDLWTAVNIVCQENGKETLEGICYLFLESGSWQTPAHNQVLQNRPKPVWLWTPFKEASNVCNKTLNHTSMWLLTFQDYFVVYFAKSQAKSVLFYPRSMRCSARFCCQ